jgi:pro-apoptotic serine protease NMA111
MFTNMKRILRKGVEMDALVPTISGEVGETDRFVLWAGALLHAPHRAVRQQSKFLHSLVYISGLYLDFSHADL